MDLRDEIFQSLEGREVSASLEVAERGIVCGVEDARKCAAELGLTCIAHVRDGDRIREEETLLSLRGTPKAVAIAEENLVGALAKTSGIATATRRLVEEARGMRVVGGAWKKVPSAIRPQVRHAVAVGGAAPRMAEHPMVYLDKNYVRMFGGVRGILGAIRELAGHRVVIQLPGEEMSLAEETRVAAERGVDTVFVDTGDPLDVKTVIEVLQRLGLRDRVQVAFAGGVQLEDLPALKALGVDALCVGRSIVDAPLLDMRLTVGASPSLGARSPTLGPASMAVMR